MYKRSILIFLSILFLILCVIFLSSTSGEYLDQEISGNNILSSNWYHFDWLYRIPIYLQNNGDTLSDYQIRIVRNTATLISAGKLQADGDDIRFTTGDGQTLLSYWIESGINSAATVIWVKINSIPAGGSTIYFYYGNTTAAGVSSGSDTFIYFNDFEDTGDLAGWVEINSANGAFSLVTPPQVPRGNSVLLIDDTNGASNRYYGAYTTFTAQTTCVLEFFVGVAQADRSWEIRVRQNTSNGPRLRFNADSSFEYNDTAWKDFAPEVNYIANTWYELKLDEIRVDNDTYDVLGNGSLLGDNIAFDSARTALNRLEFYSATSASTADIYLDLIKIRSYAALEPTYTFGSEE